jgi:hypothetical protein
VTAIVTGLNHRGHISVEPARNKNAAISLLMQSLFMGVCVYCLWDEFSVVLAIFKRNTEHNIHFAKCLIPNNVV